jgi:hypothetical protein
VERDSAAYCSRAARPTSVWRRPEADRPPNVSDPGCGQLADTQSQGDPICQVMVDPGSHKAPPSLHVLEEQCLSAETGRRGIVSARATSASSGQGILRRHTQATKAALRRVHGGRHQHLKAYISLFAGCLALTTASTGVLCNTSECFSERRTSSIASNSVSNDRDEHWMNSRNYSSYFTAGKMRN